MKFFKKLLLGFIILIVSCFLFRGWIYRHAVAYQSVGPRVNYIAKDPQLIQCIETGSAGLNNPDARSLIVCALTITSNELNFTAANNEIDPNKLIHTKTAHCVGYAAFCATTCNYLFHQYKLDDNWLARPQIGHLYLFGTDIHPYFHSAFFKDHDFVVIENKQSGEVYAVDPTVHDYVGIEYVKCRSDSKSLRH
jgi:hypothetical protein